MAINRASIAKEISVGDDDMASELYQIVSVNKLDFFVLTSIVF